MSLKEKAKEIKLVITDVDGVLTEGKIFLGTDHQEWKAFHAQDGLGIALAQKAGIKIAIITGRYSEAVERRAQELSIEHLYQKISNKREVFFQILEKLHLTSVETAYIGDDLNDLPILAEVGLKLAVANAVLEVRERVDYITQKAGGQGAVREALEAILKAQGKWEGLVEAYLRKPEEGGQQ